MCVLEEHHDFYRRSPPPFFVVAPFAQEYVATSPHEHSLPSTMTGTGTWVPKRYLSYVTFTRPNHRRRCLQHCKGQAPRHDRTGPLAGWMEPRTLHRRLPALQANCSSWSQQAACCLPLCTIRMPPRPESLEGGQGSAVLCRLCTKLRTQFNFGKKNIPQQGGEEGRGEEKNVLL